MNKTIVFIFLISVFFLTFLPIKDTDFGWHYRCGKNFWERKSLCTKNEFSYFLPDYQSANPHLIYDVILSSIYDHFGFNGLSLLSSLLMVLAGALFLCLTAGLLWIKIIGFLMIIFLSNAVFGLGLRSQIISYIFFLIALLLLKKSQDSKKYLLLLPGLFLIWVNIHIGFFIGLILLSFFITKNIKKNLPIYKIAIFVFCVLATLINPFGVNVYKEIVNHAFSPLNRMIAEWVEPPIWQMALIVLLTTIVLIKSFKTRKLSLYQFLLLIFFAILGLKAKRNLPFFYTIFFYVFLDQYKLIVFQKINQVISPLLITGIIFLLIVLVPQTISFNQSWDSYCDQGLSRYPCMAIKNYPELSGNVYAMYEWGGFLIWQKPNIKVFVDGRMPAWNDENGQSPYQVFLNIIQTQPGWNEKLNKLKTNYLLIQNGTFLDLLLQKESRKYGWQEKYRDNVAVVYKNQKL